MENQLGYAELRFQLQGDPASPRVLFLHGFWGDRHSFAEIIEGLGDRVYALSLDLPGHGPSPMGDCSMESVAAQVIALVDRLEFWPCTIVGYSLGGRLALYLALTRLDSTQLTGLVLESASPGLAEATARADRRRADEIWARRLELEPIERVLDDWYRQPIFSSLVEHRSFPELRSRRLTHHGPSLAMVMRGLGLGQQPNLWPLLPLLTIPTLLIVGDRDTKFCQLNRQIQGQNPDQIKLKTMPNCGHNCHIEDPNIYAATVLSCLRYSSRQSQSITTDRETSPQVGFGADSSMNI
jgi:2-succinyl-6-hydroxy-2,4-cyclohexadiene-1-carboxylate synthase